MESESKINEIATELEKLQDLLKSGRRLNDLQIEDNNRLKQELSGLKKENDMLCKEIAILENESSKLRNDNDNLRGNIIKLDKIVYGVSGGGKKK